MTLSGRDPLNLMVSRVLAAGLTASLGAMALGLMLGRGAPPSPAATPLPLLWPALKALEPNAFLSLGIVLLLATPALRVLVLLGGFVRRKEWLFAAIAAVVFAILIVSVRSGLRG